MGGITHCKPILEVRSLSITYVTKDFSTCYAINDASFAMEKGYTIGPETGTEKTAIAKGILRLLLVPQRHLANGTVVFGGEDLCSKNKRLKLIHGRMADPIDLPKGYRFALCPLCGYVYGSSRSPFTEPSPRSLLSLSPSTT